MIRFRPLLIPTLWFLPALFLLVGLGIWQLERLQQKEALIAAVETGFHAPPLPVEDVLRNSLEKAEWHHVQLNGYFLHDKEVYLFAQGPKNAVGVQVITPFVLDDGETLLINRGFVPNALRLPNTRSAGQVKGKVSLAGVLRLTQGPGLFTPSPDFNSRLWFVKDVPSIARAIGIKTPPIIIEADATPNPGRWPLGGQTVIDFPNSHLQYAITWFGLALALTGVYVFFHLRQGCLTF